MKLSKKLEAEILQLYYKYWDAYLKGHMRIMSSLMAKNCHVIGSGMGEVFKNKKDAVKYYTATADQVAGVSEMRNRNISVAPAGNNILVTEESDFYVLMEESWTFYGQGRFSTLFSKTEKTWLIIQQHGSLPDSRTGGGEQLNTDKIKVENLRLKDAIKRRTIELEQKNRELEIESTLEKVRSSALAMKEPADMVDVCRIISDQLQTLGVKNTRNVQTAIINEQKSTYLNYQYFTAYNKSTIEEAEYNKHPKAREMAETMKKSVEAFFSQSFDGEELSVFREYRKQDNQFPDPILDESTSLHFYFYSIGPGALGLSTYNTPLSESDMNILKRFRNVFELAYRRFIDIQKAEAQAREAQIEAALEKVRAVAMSMNKPDDLLNICEVLFKEFQKLGFGELRNTMINIHNDDNKTFRNYDYSDEIGKSITLLNFNAHPVMEKQIKQSRIANDAFSEAVYEGKDLEEWKEFRRKYGEKDDPRIDEIKALYYYFYSIGTGTIGISTFSQINEQKLILLKRFRNVFSLSYQRYSDIAQAEAQARESQIEAALERVRSRTMGMQKSEELKEVIQVVYEQFVHLNIKVEHTGFVIDYKATDDYNIWIADPLGVPSQVTVPYFDSVYYNRFNEAKEKGEDFFATNLSFEEKNKFYQKLFEYVPGLPEEAKEFYFSCPGLAGSTVLLEDVCLYIENFSGIPYSDEENNTLMRFGNVFQQTYTRFNDLQKAEAQVREAQIEAALERTRTQSMIMQHSKELDDTLRVFHQQVLLLGINSAFSFLWLPDEEKDRHIFWAAWAENKSGSITFKSKAITYPLNRNEPATAQCLVDWKSDEPVHSYTVSPAEVENYFAAWKELIDGVEKLKPEHFPVGLYYVEAFMKYGCFGVMIEYEMPEEEKKILGRFAIEFERTYTRFLDLKKAEAQNVIIQAENERKTKELEEARQLQLSMLPKELPNLPHLDIAVYMKTATEVGGDYYDFSVDNTGTLTILVGDATGHGMMSGMMVSIMKSFFISNRTNIELKHFFENSNNSIKDMQLGRLMMPLMGVQITSKKVMATNAGMPSLIYFRNKSQKAGEFVSNNMPLGAMKGTKYLLKEINYEKGDTLLLMSDGFAELKNENNEQYGYPRIIEEFKSVAQKDPEEIVEYLKNSSSQWANGVEPDDDVTFIVIKVKS